jgi:hypothetical protein
MSLELDKSISNFMKFIRENGGRVDGDTIYFDMPIRDVPKEIKDVLWVLDEQWGIKIVTRED